MRATLPLALCLLASAGAATADEAHLDLLRQSIALERIATTPGQRAADAIPAAWRTQGTAVAADADPVLAAKARRLGAWAELLARSTASGAPAAPRPVPEPMRLSGTAGRSCAAAIPLPEGRALRVRATPGEALWFRVDAGTARALNVATHGSTVDPALSAFEDCRVLDRAPAAASDDNLGLQAELTLLPGKQTFWFVRADVLAGNGDLVLAAQRAIAVTGRVTRQADGAPLRDVRIAAFRVDGSFASYVTDTGTNANGEYALTLFGSNTYAFRTGEFFFNGSPAVVHEAFDGFRCGAGSVFDLSPCGPTGANYTPVTLSDPGTRTIDFALERAGVLTGTVTSSRGGPVAGAQVVLHTTTGNQLSSTLTDVLGRYRFEGAPATPTLVSAGSADHARTLHAGVECANSSSFFDCPWSAGAPVAVAPESSGRIDFVLRRQQFVEVVLTLDGQPAPTDPFSSAFEVTLLNSNGATVATGAVVASARYRMGPVAPGSYRMRVRSNRAYPQLFPDVRCASDCFAELPQSGVITVAGGGADTLLDMDLRRYPRISGRLTTEGSGAPIGGADVQMFSASNSFTSYLAITNSNGEYTVASIAPGSYVVRFASSQHGDEVHADLPCESGNPLLDCPGATLVTFGLDAADRVIDAALQPSARVSGRITSGGQPLFGSFVSVVILGTDGSVRRAIGTSIGSDGRYRADDVPPGTALVALRVDSQGFLPQIWPSVDCPAAQFGGPWTSCALAQATPVTFVAGTERSGIDLDLRSSGSQAVRVLNAFTDTPLQGVVIDVWNAAGQRVDTRATGADGRAYPWTPFSGAAAPHALSTDNDQGLINEVFQDILCPTGSVYFGTCALTGFTPVLLPAVPNAPEITWRVSRPIPIFGANFEN